MKNSTGNDQPPRTVDFDRHLQHAIQVVKTWQLWEQELLGRRPYYQPPALGANAPAMGATANVATTQIAARTKAGGPSARRAGSKVRDRTVYRRANGKWANKRNDASKASSVHDTQEDAENAAREMLRKQGGGELTTKGGDGKIRSRDTSASGNEPNPPKNREH